jgi:hypothetical protein
MVSSATPTVISSDVPPNGNCCTGRKNAKKIAGSSATAARNSDPGSVIRVRTKLR